MDVKVKDHDDIVKDGFTGAVLSSPEALKAYRLGKSKKLRERDKEREFQTLKNEVKDLKALLLEALRKIDELHK